MNRFVGKLVNLPEGWKTDTGHAPKGYTLCNNGKSLFADDYRWGYVFDQEWWEYEMHRAELDYRERLDRAEKALTDEQREYWLNRANILKIFGGENESTCI